MGLAVPEAKPAPSSVTSSCSPSRCSWSLMSTPAPAVPSLAQLHPALLALQGHHGLISSAGPLSRRIHWFSGRRFGCGGWSELQSQSPGSAMLCKDEGGCNIFNGSKNLSCKGVKWKKKIIRKIILGMASR